MQEAIAVKHLKLDVNKSGALHEDSNSLEKFKELMDDLDNLSSEIKNLHKSWWIVLIVPTKIVYFSLQSKGFSSKSVYQIHEFVLVAVEIKL